MSCKLSLALSLNGLGAGEAVMGVWGLALEIRQSPEGEGMELNLFAETTT